MTPKLRLYVEVPLGEAISIEPHPAQCHYLLTVMRQREGDQIALFNGTDGEWRAVVEPTTRRRCVLHIKEQLRAQAPEPGPVLLFAPLKRNPQELLVEKTTELGVARLEPVLMQRSVVERLNRERLRGIAMEAAEQSGRLTVPEITLPVPIEDHLAERAANGPLYLADEAREGLPFTRALAERGPGDVLIGPEGGFAPEEREFLHQHNDIVPVALGPRLLRAETAAIAAVACWQAVLSER